MKCPKCDGKGVLPGFGHINNGICFKCNGAGECAEPKRSSHSYARLFIAKYAGIDGDGFFPTDVVKWGEVQYVFGPHVGHCSAEHRVMYFKGDYYVGQPICRSSTWYRVPEDCWEEFIFFYNRVNGKYQQLH